ncbi:4-hydroxy-tetrahydrodipicolinate reductase [Halogeometricum sp. CBA1124]|uniref:4-hydroxy-tetrahydrodipicolinate reductase n=1 Tax=Halogeometricum sp. CBA1124 TaxID=2668071 RepID=UPI001429B6E9|nr:4-hydroxy-tetrahydrodipicolinate reductase [Halogeometricum sp. CBA1124]MUV58166.1 4-hydroxy-tetrahydrodipicolinate reductase [Halogeometricum sp. CBA1124]
MGDPVRVAVTGAAGRMGRELLDVAAGRDDVSVVLAVNRSPVESVSGVDVHDAADLSTHLAETDPDVLVDFTGPESSTDYAAACAEAGVGIVVGTTGFDADGRAALDEAAESVPLLHATNFSRGVAALRRAVREAVAALPDYDVEVTETHHNGKRDAPSGTATTLLDEVDDVRGASDRVYGREGDQPRTEGEIGVHARRAGGVTGEHEVLLADDHQLLSLTHRAGSRGVFAAGALDAAVWLADRDAGRYDFDEVLDA